MQGQVSKLGRKRILDRIRLTNPAIATAPVGVPIGTIVEKLVGESMQFDNVIYRVVGAGTMGAEHAATTMGVIQRAELITQAALADFKAEMLAGNVFDGMQLCPESPHHTWVDN